jgi:hypothetical protein
MFQHNVFRTWVKRRYYKLNRVKLSVNLVVKTKKEKKISVTNKKQTSLAFPITFATVNPST